ncbi:4Fe-4S dicluster domain-containing protein [Candidatus Bathyarchaeota archaeon]|nr:4Fe-4S dicluster domain-containing protein [Candidatus Bathyarchaeota archaeon]
MPVRIWRTPLDIEKAKRPQVKIHIIKDQCKGCGFCIQFCPRDVLEKSQEINRKGIHPPKITDEARCVACSFCTSICPDLAIFVVEKSCKEDVDHD